MQFNQNVFVKLLGPQLRRFVRFKTSQTHQEVKIPVPWGHVAARWWGRTDRRPVLTLHGWQDNCGSFNRLIPLLNDDLSFLAIDFPGHGLSSRIPSGMYCHFQDYLLVLSYVINYFKWDKVSLMGHSLGGSTSFKYASTYPDKVDFLIFIDGMKPTIENEIFANDSRRLTNFLRYSQFEQSGEESPSYTLEEIKRRVCAPHNKSLSFEHSDHIIERSIAPSKKNPGQFYFTTDPRLKAGELMNWPQEDSVCGAARITCPVFIAKAIDGLYYDTKENFYEVVDVLKKSSIDCQYHRVEGTHHMHLNNPEILADLINKFLDKHVKK